MIGLISAPPLYPFLVSISKILLYGFFFALITQKDREETSPSFKISLLLISGIEAVITLFSFLFSPLPKGWLPNNPGYSALLIAPAFTFSILEMTQKSPSARKLTWFGFALIQGVALYILQSRAVFIGLLASTPFLFPKKSFKQLFLLFLMMLVAMFSLQPDILLNLFKVNLSNLELGRLVIWKTAIPAILEKWLWGWGQGNFESAYFQYQNPSNSFVQYSKTTLFAHNDFLQMMTTIGIPGTLVFFYLITKSINLKVFKNWDNFDNRWLISTLLIYLFASLTNYPFYLPINGFCFIFIIHRSLQPGLPITGNSIKIFKGLLSIFLLFFVLNTGAEWSAMRGNFSLAVRLNPLRHDLWYAKALDHIQKNDPPSALESLRTALIFNNKDPFIWSRLGRTQKFWQIGNDEIIREYLEKATLLAPKHAPFWIDLGFHLLDMGNTINAKESFKNAIRLEPNTSTPYYSLGASIKKEGKSKLAEKMLFKAIQIKKAGDFRHDKSNYSKFLFEFPEILRKS